ncbi:LuxR C-terminal-related transcriptional regulator [Microbacterium sp. RD1]|uniref:LuxR C-terminal-related transcriptional regulator n=1 Tax=Microbacterium sp. RD1 TaxID=3457313 RepID=UPI003FA547A0
MTILAVPRLPPRLAARSRLTERLDAAAAVVVLHAPSGFGKTAALTQWATATDRHGLWFRVREGLAEPAAFVRDLSAELDAVGLLEADNPLRTASETLSLGEDPWRMVGRGLRRIPGTFTLVLDEAEHLDDDTAAGILRTVAENPDLSLRVATRRADRFTEPGLDVALEVERLGPADLALTEAEVVEILGPAASAQTVAHVLEHGASAALARVVGLSGRTDATGAADPVASLLRMRAPAWDAAFRTFLERISLSEAVDADLARQLTNDPDAVALLDRAESEGLGYWSSPPAPDREGTLFIPSPVFRRILDATSRRRLPARLVRSLDARIARWNLDHGRPYPALQAAVHARDWALVTDVVRQHWSDLFADASEVRELFRRVPPLTLRAQPLVSMLLALLYNARAGHRLRALEFFTLAAYGARTQRATAAPADRALLAAVESAAHRVSGREAQALRAAEAGFETMSGMTPEERDRLGRNAPTVDNQIGLSLYYGGRTDEALAAFRRSEATAAERGLHGGIQALAHTAGILAASGEIREATAVADAALSRHWPEGWLTGYPGSLLRAALAWIALENDDPDAAEAEMAVLAPHRQTIEHWALLEEIDVLIRILRGDVEDAAAQADRSEQRQQERKAVGPSSRRRMQRTRVLIEVARGDLPAADRAASALPAGAERDIARARIRLAAGDSDAALQILATVPVGGPDARLRAEHLSLTAGALALRADADETLRALRALAVHLDRCGLTLPLSLVPVDALEAARDVVAGTDLDDVLGPALERSIARRAIGSRARGPEFTPREQVVARSLASGATIAQIAADLSVSPNTVKSQVKSVYRKLGVASREEAVRALALHAADGALGAEQTAG